MLQNPRFLGCIGMRSWNLLMRKVMTVIGTKVALQVSCNGHHFWLYHIKKHEPFDARHLCAVKLYTDYSKLCKVFCTVLREGDPAEVAQIANMTQLLIETVQCYGTELTSDKTYYRGVTRTFMFRTIVSRFNLPQSTTTAVKYTFHNPYI